MLIHEDAGLEEFAMSCGFDVIVPVSIFIPESGEEPLITAYRNVWDECAAYESAHKDDLLNPVYLDELCCKIDPTVSDMGYRIDRKESRVVLEYRIRESNHTVTKASENAVIIHSVDEIDGLECPLLHTPDPDEEDETGACAVVVKDHVICACAGVNDYSDDDSLEIFVETAKDHRGKGYGTAAVASLVRHLCELGYKAAYNCAESNASSSAIANKLGMTFTGRRFSLICYAGETTET